MGYLVNKSHGVFILLKLVLLQGKRTVNLTMEPIAVYVGK